MSATLNISLSPDQLAWIKGRKEQEGFATSSDVVRDLIRREQEREWERLKAQFEDLAQESLPGPAPVGKIVAAVRKVRRELRPEYEAARRS
jgi:Arc/MetJ-type ribon-helix-helix transcriptional regulator